MPKKIQQFRWYKSVGGSIITFFFAVSGQKLETAQYNAVGFQKERDSAWKYVGFTGYNSHNPSIWKEIEFPKELPSSFLTYVIIELFSVRLDKILWQK